ncbi:LysR family transcriptional regulator [Burkholderia sp. Ac-20379]|uniref:LysR family transcriptional regulator n=1 Tax=Burkholderia sp. Ac-20379 TaxID=2703900 RepID=UPI00197F0FA2|nr:LysR family transcriptional regulator [Burkholderia sp. Ac-20379]MBN3724696.1 LysR family transcriptional regulator [Burkholderia sp. Ac-20379]
MPNTSELPSWDDLRIVKAIGDHGGLTGAAAALQLNHSTISRRLATIEKNLKVALFDRRRVGYQPTAAGADLMSLCERVEKDVVGVVRRVAGNQQSYKGDLRVTTSDALLVDFLTDVIADFLKMNPGIRIEVIVGNKALNLARGDSDIAFRATRKAPDNLFGRKLATIAWAIYAQRTEQPGPFPSMEFLHQRQWVSYGKSLAGLRAFDYVNAHVPRDRIVYRSDSVAGVAAAIGSGIGIGLLPCMHADRVPGIMRVSPVEASVFDELWVLTHPDIRRSGRVYAFLKHCSKALLKHLDLIEGRGAK